MRTDAPDGRRGKTVCMIAYAKYFTDARIKNYVGALLRDGYEVDVFALGEPGPVVPGLRVFRLMSKVSSTSALRYAISQLWFLLIGALRVGLASVRRHYAVVHVHNMPDYIVFAAVIPKLMGAKVILDVHDTMPEAYATKFSLSLSHPMIRLIRLEERVSAAFADHVITTNDLHKEALTDHGIPADKISIVMNVGDGRIFYPPPQLPRHCGLTLGYHGTIAERLGPDLILQAIRQVRDSCPNLRLILVGNGEYLPTIRRMIAERSPLSTLSEVVGEAEHAHGHEDDDEYHGDRRDYRFVFLRQPEILGDKGDDQGAYDRAGKTVEKPPTTAYIMTKIEL